MSHNYSEEELNQLMICILPAVKNYTTAYIRDVFKV